MVVSRKGGDSVVTLLLVSHGHSCRWWLFIGGCSDIRMNLTFDDHRRSYLWSPSERFAYDGHNVPVVVTFRW